MIALLSRAGRSLPVLVAIAVFLPMVGLGTGVASAQTAPQTDQLKLERLGVYPLSSDAPANALRFEIQAGYELRSVANGFVVLFVFEEGSNNTTQRSSDAVPVEAGNGRVTLDVEYLPRPEVKGLTLVVTLFDENRKLLGWLATNPLPMDSWGGRLEFQRAMAARVAGNHQEAIDHLTRALELAPDTGNFYYWRADARTNLKQFDEAITDYSKALELMPEHRASILGRGVAWLWLGQWSSVVSDLSTLLAMSDEQDEVTAWAHRARGIANAVLWKPSEAIDDYEAYLSLMPDAPDRLHVEGWIADLRSIALESQPSGGG